MKDYSISHKQFVQLICFITRTQSFIIPDGLPLLEIMKRCANYCLQMRINKVDCSEPLFKDIDRIIKRYYPFGFKENRNAKLNRTQWETIAGISRNPRFTTNIFPSETKSVEKILFIRTLRACNKFLRSKHTECDKSELIESLEQIRILALG